MTILMIFTYAFRAYWIVLREIELDRIKTICMWRLKTKILYIISWLHATLGRSVRQSVRHAVKIFAKNYLNCITAPAQPYTTNAVLYQ